MWSAAALGLYLVTGARGLMWADSSKLTLYALSAYLPSLNPGDHAGWTLLAAGWLRLAGGDPVASAHRLSAIAGALAVGLLFLLLRTRGAARGEAHTGVAVATVSLPVWWAATTAETYSAALALTLAGGVIVRTRVGGWRWPLAGLTWGLAFACHAMALLLIVPLVWEAERSRGWRVIPWMALGTAPMWLAVLGAPADPLTGFAAASGSTWRWHWEAFVALARVPRGLLVVAALLLYAVGAFGAIAFWRGRGAPRPSAVWPASLGVLALFLATYATYRIHLMTAFLLVGLLLALPVRLGGGARVAHVVAQVALYLAVPAVLTIGGWQDLGVRVLPHRNNAFYFLCPVKSAALAGGLWKPAELFDPGTEAYVADLGRCAPEGAAVLADFNAGAPLCLAQRARGWRRDLGVRPVAVDVAAGSPDQVAELEAAIRRELAARPVVLADTYRPYYRTDELAARFAVTPCRAGAVVAALPGGGGR